MNHGSGGCKLKTAPVRPVVAARPQNMYALRTCFVKDSSPYVDPQSIDTVLLSVGAESSHNENGTG